MYDSWDTELNRQNFFSFWTNFYSFTAPPTPPTQQPKELNFWKNEKKTKKTNARGIIILHKCTINDKHMIYGSWYINCNR